MRWLSLLALAGCATLGPRGIARDLDRQLTFLADWPLSVRCQAVRDAVARCEAAGLPPDCAWNGWDDQDRDSFTIAACLEEDAR
jgi:hypothetical protein